MKMKMRRDVDMICVTRGLHVSFYIHGSIEICVTHALHVSVNTHDTCDIRHIRFFLHIRVCFDMRDTRLIYLFSQTFVTRGPYVYFYIHGSLILCVTHGL